MFDPEISRVRGLTNKLIFLKWLYKSASASGRKALIQEARQGIEAVEHLMTAKACLDYHQHVTDWR